MTKDTLGQDTGNLHALSGRPAPSLPIDGRLSVSQSAIVSRALACLCAKQSTTKEVVISALLGALLPSYVTKPLFFLPSSGRAYANPVNLQGAFAQACVDITQAVAEKVVDKAFVVCVIGTGEEAAQKAQLLLKYPEGSTSEDFLFHFSHADYHPVQAGQFTQDFLSLLQGVTVFPKSPLRGLLNNPFQGAEFKAYSEAAYPLSPTQEGMLFQAFAAEQESGDTLSPMQQGMFCQSLRAPEGAGVYVEQVHAQFQEALDESLFLQSWRRIIGHHPILRTCFSLEEGGAPQQYVLPEIPLLCIAEDWRRVKEAEQEKRLHDYILADRQRGFSFGHAPMLRLAIFRRDDAAYDFVWTIHHILVDGRAMAVVLQQVFACYEALQKGEGYQPAPSPSYRAYIERLQKLPLTNAELYWRRLLKGFNSPTTLPFPAPEARPSVQDRRQELSETLTAALEESVLSSTLTAQLQDWAKQNGFTLNTLLQGVWAILLHHYSGEEDVLFGATKAVRHLEEATADSVGVYINTLPIRVRVSDSLKLLPWLQELRRQWVALREVEHTPLPKIHQWSEVPGGLALFETYYVFENATLDQQIKASPGNWAHRNFDLLERTPLPLILAGHSGEALELCIEYDRRRFDCATIRSILGHLQCALNYIAAHPDSRIGDVPLLSDEDRRQLLSTWREEAQVQAPLACIHHLFEAVAARQAEAPAVVQEDSSLSYGVLNQRANQLAHHLRSLGVGPDMPVGLCLPRSPEMMVAVLGVLKAGGAYLPIDPAYPEDRLAFLCEDAQLSVLLTEAKIATRFPKPPVHTLCLDSLQEVLATQSTENPDAPVQPQHLAYIIYTSGSTGTPKGVMIDHRALVAFSHSAIKAYGIGPKDRVLQFASLSFDAAAEEIYPCLLQGATLVLRTEDMLASAAAFYQRCREMEVTVLDLPTAYWHVLCDEAPQEQPPEAVRLVIIGGEAARADKLGQWLDHVAPRVRLLNTYGPTETTVVATYSDLQRVPSDGAVSIGRPLPTVQAYVLNSKGALCPIGVPGELCLAGPQLARGYWAREELTQKAFTNNPLNPEERLYRTGDKVRLQADGEIIYLGRLDRQVKIRGFRIELGELEHVLNQHPLVSEAAVVVREESPGNKQLAAYIVATQGAASPDVIQDVRAWLPTQVPEYMCPPLFTLLDAMPMTPTGKTDRKALPAPATPGQTRSIVAPKTATERELVRIWSQVLDLPQVSSTDDFLQLGGDSLLGVQILSRIEKTLGLRLPMEAILRHGVLTALAAHIDQEQRREVKEEALPQTRPQETFPLSFDQQLLWLYEQVYPDTPNYHIPMAYRIRGNLKVDLLEETLNELIRRHPALYTHFELAGEEAVQQLAAPWSIHLRQERFNPQPIQDRAQRLQHWLCTEAARPFDLSHGPLLRATLLRMGEEDAYLVMTIHHIVSDGWSVGLIIRELNALYTALAEGKKPILPSPSHCYADFVAWQQNRYTALEADLSAYWRNKLADPLPQINWPSPEADVEIDPRPGGQYPVRLSKDVCERLRELGRESNATLFMTLLATFKLMLARYTGETDILVGATMANRNRIEWEKIIGFFINTVAFRTSLAENPDFETALGRVRKTVLAAYAHQEMPFDQLRKLIEKPESKGHLLQTLFLMQSMEIPPLKLPETQCATVNIDMGKAIMDLTIELYETADGVSGWFEYKTAFFSRKCIAQLAAYFEAMAESIASAPEKRLIDLPFFHEVAASEALTPLPSWQAPIAPETVRPRARRATVVQVSGNMDATEEKLAQLWKEVLGIREVNRGDNFFDLGGHSLLAVVLLSRIEKSFGKRVPPLRLYQAPVLAHLAGFLRDTKVEEPLRALHPIQAQGSRRPFFFVGSTDCIPPLVESLGEDQPLYSLNIFGLQPQDDTIPELRVEDVAANYIREIRSIQPQGPYALGAYCRDVFVAFEMAHQLRAAGEKIALLALVDAVWDELSWQENLMRHARNLRNFGPAYLVRKIRKQRKMIQEKIHRITGRAALHSQSHLGTNLAHRRLDALFINAFYDAIAAYEPKAYEGEVTLLLASEWGRDTSTELETLVKGPIHIKKIHAYHDNLWEVPQVDEVGRALRAALEKSD